MEGSRKLSAFPVLLTFFLSGIFPLLRLCQSLVFFKLTFKSFLLTPNHFANCLCSLYFKIIFSEQAKAFLVGDCLNSDRPLATASTTATSNFPSVVVLMFFWQKIAALSIRVHGSSDILCYLFWNTSFSPFEGSSFWQMDPVHLALLSTRLFQDVQLAFSVPLYSLVPWDESSLPPISLVLSPALPVLCSDHIFPVFFISLSCSFDLAALCSHFF